MAKVKVPKRVGGVKVPKKVRKQAKKALELIDSPAARDLALAGLAIAAERGASTADGANKRQRQSGSRTRSRTAWTVSSLARSLRAAAVEGARRFLEGFEEGAGRPKSASPARPAKTVKPASPARPKRSARPASTAKPGEGREGREHRQAGADGKGREPRQDREGRERRQAFETCKDHEFRKSCRLRKACQIYRCRKEAVARQA